MCLYGAHRYNLDTSASNNSTTVEWLTGMGATAFSESNWRKLRKGISGDKPTESQIHFTGASTRSKRKILRIPAELRGHLRSWSHVIKRRMWRWLHRTVPSSRRHFDSPNTSETLAVQSQQIGHLFHDVDTLIPGPYPKTKSVIVQQAHNVQRHFVPGVTLYC
jgi:hypothetical protein